MSPTWREATPPPEPELRGADRMRIALRGSMMGVVTFGGLALLLLVRLLERPIHGVRRPWTPSITQAVCRANLRILGLASEIEGTPLDGPGAIVANHATWLDIFVLNAAARIYFVSKSEVAGWPGVGWLARATGTVFIERDPRRARDHTHALAARMGSGHPIVFFPEGTSTDGLRVLEFKSTLFAPLCSAEDRGLRVQPATIRYMSPPGEDPRFYGWWGDMEFGPNFRKMLAAPRHGHVRVRFDMPLQPGADRKALALRTGTIVRDAHAGHAVSPGAATQ
ncbi:MAG: lysophospholipid acyltransferase family protein [Pseudomonadota bacterium]